MAKYDDIPRIISPKAGDRIILPEFGNLTVVEVLTGYYNLVIHVTDPGSRHLMVKQSHDTYEGETAEQLCDLLDAYVRKLDEIGVRVPPPSTVSFSLSRGAGEQIYVTEVAPYGGSTVHNLLRTNPSELAAVKLTRNMLRVFKPLLLKATVGPRLDVGIDPIPRNICFDGANFTYIDFFVPKMFDGTVHRLEMPSPRDNAYELGVWRHYDKVGLVVVLITQVARLKPSAKHAVELAISTQLSEHRELKETQLGVEDFISRIHDKTPADFRRWIPQLGFMEIYDLRALACEFGYRCWITPAEVEEFFQQSHFLHEDLLPEKIEALQRFLLEKIPR